MDACVGLWPADAVGEVSGQRVQVKQGGLTGVFHVDVVDEFTEQPEVFLTARAEHRLLFKVLHLYQKHKYTFNTNYGCDFYSKLEI